MGKYSDFERVERDFYPTPIEAVEPLIPHLPKCDFHYIEPCAGDGRLVRHLTTLTSGRAICTYASDIEPSNESILKQDAFDIQLQNQFNFVITNPPWNRKFLHPFISHFASQTMTWLLFDSNWAFTRQAIPHLKWCKKIVAVGRVKWIENSDGVGKEDCAWYLFDRENKEQTKFYGQMEKSTGTHDITEFIG